MTYETIRFDTADGVATLTLARPQVLNAFSLKMHEELRAALKDVGSDTAIRCLVVTGEGRGFCSGQDLADRRPDGAAVDFGDSLDKNYNRLVRTLRALDKPVVMAVNGVAAGAGANFALAGDICIAAASAEFVQAFVRIGLIPDCGGTYFLPRLVGHARALGLAMLGDKLPAATAAEWGLIWKCVPDDRFAEEVAATARRLAQAPTRALTLMRRAFDASGQNSLDRQLDLERDLQVVATRTADFAEGVTAFLEKRKPNYSGR